jgi:hypothetical protein
MIYENSSVTENVLRVVRVVGKRKMRAKLLKGRIQYTR